MVRVSDMNYDDQMDKQIRSYRMLFEIENEIRVATYNSFLLEHGSEFFNQELLPKFKCVDFLPDKEFDIVSKANSKYGEYKKEIQNKRFSFTEHSPKVKIL